MRPSLLACAALMLLSIFSMCDSNATSVYPVRMNDPQAVFLTPENFEVYGDGISDDADALQQAINKVQETTRNGIVFVPEGRYRLGKTVHVWEGIRLIGFGAKRPVFVLREGTPGFQETSKYDPDKPGTGNYMLHFCCGRPLPGQPVHDANPGTFYSGLSNIDIEIMDGNPAAVGVRFHVAQHSFISHVDFRIGSGKAGVEDVGNEMEDCRFFGGNYGITTSKTSPSWPFLLIDSSFEGQRVAAIETEEAGLTLVRDQFKNVPSVVIVRPGRDEELWIKDSRFENVSGPAIVISHSTNARSQTNLQGVICKGVPVLVSFADSGKTVAGEGGLYEVRDFCHGLQFADMGAGSEIRTSSDLQKIKAVTGPIQPAIPALPDGRTWVNFAALGAVGDGETDCTDLLKEAVARYRTIYLPSGRYRVSDTIVLRSDTVLVGMNPITTQLSLSDGTPGFDGEIPPKPLLIAPKEGTNIVSGIGLDTGNNNSAIAVKWMAGSGSLMNDVRFLGGHGTFKPDGTRVPVYNSNRTGDADEKRRWDSQYYSLWITDGGGGIFKDIWTPNTCAQAGIYISETKTPGRMYAVSVEHHVRNEIKLRNVSNWEFFAMQLEEEHGEGPRALPVSIENCGSLLFGNLFLYRVAMDSPSPCGVKVKASGGIVFRGVHAYSPGKTTCDNTIVDEISGREVRAREIARLDFPSKYSAKSETASASPVLAVGAKLEKVTGGFDFIDGATADRDGNLYFIDGHWHRIYRWTPSSHDLTLVRDNPIDPLALKFDRAGNLLVVSRTGMVYAFDPKGAEDEIKVLEPQLAGQRTGCIPVYAVNRWRDEHDFLSNATESKPYHYVSPDGTVFIPADEEFRSARRIQRFQAVDLLQRDPKNSLRQGSHWIPDDLVQKLLTPNFMTGTSGTGQAAGAGLKVYPRIRFSTVGLLRAYQLNEAHPGCPLYISDEFAQQTWSFSVDETGNLSDPKLFAEEGEAGVAVDAKGNVYIAAGDVFVYAPDGRRIDTIKVPERPASLVFGGKDGKTLFITARSSLYAVQTKFGGH